MRSTKPVMSSSSNALSSDSIGTRWRTFANLSEGVAPSRFDGLSGRISAGKRASIAALRWRSAS